MPRGATTRPVQMYLKEDTYERLRALAVTEERSLGNMAAILVSRGLTSWRSVLEPQTEPTAPEPTSVPDPPTEPPPDPAPPRRMFGKFGGGT